MRLLVVDDDLLLAQMVARLFQLSGWQVCTTLGVEDAVDCLEAYPFDVVVTDLDSRGPLGDGGVLLARRLRQARPGVRLVLFTAEPVAARRAELHAAFAAVVAKPAFRDLALAVGESAGWARPTTTCGAGTPQGAGLARSERDGASPRRRSE